MDSLSQSDDQSTRERGRVASSVGLERRAKKREYQKQWERERMKDPVYRRKRREQSRKGKAKEMMAHPERVKSRKAASAARNAAATAARARRTYLRNRDAILNRMRGNRKWDAEKHREYRKRASAEMPDWYVKVQLSKRSPLKEWPQALIECKRAELKLKRILCQNQKTSTNSATNCSTPTTV